VRERVALLGGSLSAGPAPGGGFVVYAVLPVGATP
jgi:signal transduction histidine kinase